MMKKWITLLTLLIVQAAISNLKAQYTNDFTPPSGADSSEVDLEAPAYFRMMKATSTDGINWTATGELVTDQGNVPDFVKRNDTLFLYYTGYRVGSYTNTTVVAISTDNGENWIFKHINLNGYGSSKLMQNGDPDVILNPDNTIKMFITTRHSGKKSVLCFSSSNGIDFSYIDVAAHSASDDIFDSNTFYYNGSWHMYAINSTNTTHWYLTSSDGIHFTKTSTYDFLEGTYAHFASNGFDDGSKYRMFTSFLPNEDLYSFTSTDGKTWSFEGTRLQYATIDGEGSYLKDPALVQLSTGTWLMVYVTRISCETFSTENIDACDSYDWNGKTLTSSGIYYDTLTNVDKCDSLMTLKLSINKNKENSETVSACNFFKWSANGQTYTTSGTYTYDLSTSEGCDSALTLFLNIKTIDTSITVTTKDLNANLLGATYQWVDCSKGYPNITGATFPKYSPLTSGSFAAIVSKDGCSDTSSCYSYNITNLSDPDYSTVTAIYPNPASDYIIISSPEKNETFFITDLMGKTLFEGQIVSDSNYISLSSLAPGSYQLIIKHHVTKFVIK